MKEEHRYIKRGTGLTLMAVKEFIDELWAKDVPMDALFICNGDNNAYELMVIDKK